MTGSDRRGFRGRSLDFDRLRRMTLGATDQGGVVTISGPAGIGKTSLLRSLLAEAEDADVRVGVGFAAIQAAPLWPWFEAISAIEPNQQLLGLGGDGDAFGSPAHLMREVERWLLAERTRGPMIIALEDLHDAVPTVIALLSYLSRRLLPAGLTIVATARPGNDDVDALVCPRVRLGGLNSASIELLAEDLGYVLEGPQIEDLRRDTAGNPLFVRRLLEHGYADASVGRAVPPDVAATILSEVAVLDHKARELVEALAVAGPVSPDVLARLVRVDPSVIRSLPGSLVDAGEVEISFAHGLVREVIYERLAAERRFALHERAAEVLGSHSSLVRAHHLGRAARVIRTADAADTAAEAGRLYESIGALTEASDHQRLCVEIRRDLAEVRPLAEALIDLARIESRLGEMPAAVASLREVAGFNPIDRDLAHRAVREYCRLRWREEPNDSQLRSRDLEAMAEQWFGASDDALDRVVLHLARFHVHEIEGLGSDALIEADRAMALASEINDPVVIAEAHLARRRSFVVHRGRLQDRARDSGAALQGAIAIGDLEMQVRAARLALTDAMAMGDRERTLALLPEDGRSISELEHQALTLATLASIRGDYATADTVLNDAVKELEALGRVSASLEFVRIVFSWDTGEFASALAGYEHLLPEIADPALRCAVALAQLFDGNNDLAALLVDEALDRLAEQPDEQLWITCMTLLAEVAACLDHPRCGEIFERLAHASGTFSVPGMTIVPWLGAVDRVLGLVCIRTGDHERARVLLERSVLFHRRMDAAPWTARSHAGLAAAHLHAGDVAAARRELDRAYALADQIDMPRNVLLWHELSAGLEANLAEGTEPESEFNEVEAIALDVAAAAGLTVRQRQVVLELVRGGTNDEISRRLGISIETVKKHLSAAYRELGVADRTSAVAALRRR